VLIAARMVSTEPGKRVDYIEKTTAGLIKPAVVTIAQAAELLGVSRCAPLDPFRWRINGANNLRHHQTVP
jgi:hypothetical protein